VNSNQSIDLSQVSAAADEPAPIALRAKVDAQCDKLVTGLFGQTKLKLADVQWRNFSKYIQSLGQSSRRNVPYFGYTEFRYSAV